MARHLSDPAPSDGTLSAEQVAAIVDALRTLDTEETCSRFHLDHERAEVILAGALVLDALLRRLGLDRLRPVEGGVGDGLLQNLIERSGLRTSCLFHHDRTFLTQAIALGEHYAFHHPHAEQVARLALAIFDRLQSLHGLGEADRMLLHGAALLHEIGQFVSFSQHHKHTQYLLMHADLPGLTETERVILACVARYHRKAHPNDRHEGYAQLAPQDRERVRRLAAVLRIASALGRNGQSVIADLDVQADRDRVVFQLTLLRQAQLDLWYARRKAALFEEVFGRRVEFAIAPSLPDAEGPRS